MRQVGVRESFERGFGGRECSSSAYFGVKKMYTVMGLGGIQLGSLVVEEYQGWEQKERKKET